LELHDAIVIITTSLLFTSGKAK